MLDTTQVIKKLKMYMAEHKLSQVQLAKKLGWTPADLSNSLTGKKPIGGRRLAHISKTLGLTFEIGHDLPGEPIPPAIGEIPVVVLGQAGIEGFYDDQGYPVGEGFRKVKRPYDVSDPNAYGVEVRGDSMAPKYDERDVVIASPRKSVASGDYVVVKTSNEEVMIKRIVFQNGLVLLESVNQAHSTIALNKEDVLFYHKIIWVKLKG